ncbi:MAG: TonB-dependent receptor [Gammaproteobacteria bacterium]
MQANRNGRRAGVALSAAFIAAGVGIPVPSAALEEIKVIARRVEERLQDVPLSVTALSGNDLEKAGIEQLGDIVQAIPSVQNNPQIGRRSAVSWAIRGQKADDVLLTQDMAVSVYVGGVIHGWPYATGNFGSLDIKSLEVIKGPVGTLFGRNSTGGAILITPNEPTDRFEGNVQVGGGTYGLATVEGVINVPLSQTLAARVAANYGRRDGTIENMDIDGRDFYNRDDWTVRGSLKWDPTERFSNLLVIDAFGSRDHGSAFKLIATRTAATFGRVYDVARRRYANEDFFSAHTDTQHPGESRNDTHGVTNTTTFEINDSLTFKNIIGYRHLDVFEESNSGGVDQNDALFLGLPLRRYSPQYTVARQITEEAQLLGEWGRLKWIVGVYYFNVDGEDWADSVSFNTADRANTSGATDGFTNESVAGFAQGTFALTDRLNFTAGVRYTTDDRSMITGSRVTTIAGVFQPNGPCLLTNAAGATLPITACRLEVSTSSSEPTYTISVDYKLADDKLVYVAHRHGYRSGGIPGRGVNAQTLEPFDPETVNDVEVGFKGDFTFGDQALRLNMAYAHQDVSDIQRNQTFFGADGILRNTVRNVADATIDSFELETTWVPFDSLEISAYYAYIDHAYEGWLDLFDPDGAGPARPFQIDRSASRFQSIPDHSGGVTVRYRLPVSGENGDFYVSGNVYAQTEYAMSNDNKLDGNNAECVGAIESGYGLFNFRVDWDRMMGNPAWSASAWGKNVTNTEYFSGGLCQYTSAVGTTWGAPNDPATYGVTVSYRFGE